MELVDYPVQAMIAVKDLAAAKQFYGETLGLTAVADNQAGIAYQSGGASVFVYVSQYAGTNQATSVSWNVSDIIGLVRKLANKGVPFKTYDFDSTRVENFVHYLGEGDDAPKAAWFSDPDGNILGLNG